MVGNNEDNSLEIKIGSEQVARFLVPVLSAVKDIANYIDGRLDELLQQLSNTEQITAEAPETSIEATAEPAYELPKPTRHQIMTDKPRRLELVLKTVQRAGYDGLQPKVILRTVCNELGYEVSRSVIWVDLNLYKDAGRADVRGKGGPDIRWVPIVQELGAVEEVDDYQEPSVLSEGTLTQKKADRHKRLDLVVNIATELGGGTVEQIHPNVEQELGYKINKETIRRDAELLVNQNRLRVEDKTRKGITQTYLPSEEETAESALREFNVVHARRAVVEYLTSHDRATITDLDAMLAGTFISIPDTARSNIMTYWKKRGIVKPLRSGSSPPYTVKKGMLRSYRSKSLESDVSDILKDEDRALQPREIREALKVVADYPYNSRHVAYALTKLPVSPEGKGYILNVQDQQTTAVAERPKGKAPHPPHHVVSQLEHALNLYGDAGGVKDLATMQLGEDEHQTRLIDEVYDFAFGVRIARSWKNGSKAVFRKDIDEDYDASKGRPLRGGEVIAIYEATAQRLDELRPHLHANMRRGIVDKETLPHYVHQIIVKEALFDALTRVHGEDSRLAKSYSGSVDYVSRGLTSSR